MLMVILVVVIAGCAKLSVDPDTNAFTYVRLGDQHISGLTIDKTETGVKVTLEGQASEATALSEAMKAVSNMSALVK
jgi:hypothetical protein